MLTGCREWPAGFRERYRREGYWRGETLGDLLREWVRAWGPRTALIHGEQRFTFAELERRVDRAAAGFWQLGLRPDDRVVVQLPNVPEFVIVCFALFRLGALPVMALSPHRKNEIQHLCAFSDAVAYVIPDRHQGFDHRTLAAEVLQAVPSLKHIIVVGEPGEYVALDALESDPIALPPIAASEVAFFLLSGGTTGLPKLIPRTHDDYAYNIRACALASRLTQSDVQLVVLPMAHNGALGCPGVLGSLSTGGCAVLSSDASPSAAFELIERHGVTLATLVPPLALLWVEAAPFTKRDLSSMRLLQVGGAKLSPELARRIRPSLGCPLQQWFGMAEGILCHTRLDDAEDWRVTSQGSPLSPADEVRVVDDCDRELPTGEVGELQVRGPTTFCGYFKLGEAQPFTSDGFLRTGDLVRTTTDGRIIVEGRIKDIINRGGEKVSAEELENHLLAHPNVRNVAVVAMPSRLLGEQTCAFVIPRESGLVLSQLVAFLRERGVAAFKFPDRLELVDELPKTSVGKVSKAQLRKQVEAALDRELAAESSAS